VEEAKEGVKIKISGVMLKAWKFWPLVHCVTYGVIPPRHRVLWVNMVDLIWNGILAGAASTSKDDEVVNLLVGENDVAESSKEEK